MNPKVDFYFEQNVQWPEEIKKLRQLVLSCGLEEELKWGCPCYRYNDTNVIVIHCFKEYCALLFFKGALIKDDEGLLIQQTKNVQAARQMRFTNLKEITKLQKQIKAYIYEAIEIEKAGLKVKLKKPEEFEMADEFAQQLKKNPALKKAFYALTPGRQRAYLLHFSGAKQSATRAARVEKAMPGILGGRGLND